MDRERLRKWLGRPDRTWRWREDKENGYSAVETTEEGLRWYRGSHDPEDGGPCDVHIQAFVDYLRRGPARAAPQEVLEELKAWVEAHGPGAS